MPAAGIVQPFQRPGEYRMSTGWAASPCNRQVLATVVLAIVVMVKRAGPLSAGGLAVLPVSRVFEFATLLAMCVHHTDLARVPDECNRASERYNDQHQH